MQFRLRFIPALLIGVSSLAMLIAAARAETLEQAVQSTLSSHPSITTAKVGSSIAEETKREERSGYYPQIGISGQAGRIYGDNSTSRGSVTTRGAAYSGYWEGGLTARQMIYDGFETSSRVDSAQAKIESAAMNVTDVGERLAFSVAQAYVDILRARTGLAMLRTQQGKVADYEGRIKTMVDDGAANEAEYQQARDIKVILDNMIADYEGQAHTAEAYYTELTGNIPAEKLTVPTPAASLIPPTADEAIAYAKGSHPALKAAALMTKSAGFDAKAEKAALYPDVDGELSYLESDKKEELGGELTDGRAVIRLNWEFETGGGQLARIEQKKLAEKEAASKVQELERQVERSIRLAYADYGKAVQQVEAQDKRITLNEKLFETYGIQFEGARVTLLQLMQSDNQLFTAHLEKMNGAYRLMAARYAILAGMGRLRESLNLAEAQPQVTPAGGPTLTAPSADEQK